MGPAGERSRWEAVVEKVERSQVGAVSSGEGAPVWEGGPSEERSMVGANMSRFFFLCRFPTLISFFPNLVWVLREVVLVFRAYSFISQDPKTVRVSHDVQRAQMRVFSVRGSQSMLSMMFRREKVHDSSVSAWAQALSNLGRDFLSCSGKNTLSSKIDFIQ